MTPPTHHQRRRPCRGRVEGRRLLRAQQPPRPRHRDPRADPGRGPRAGLDPELPGPGTVGVPLVRGRSGHGTAAGDAARGPVLPLVHRRPGERAVRERLRPAAPGGPRARPRAPQLPPPRRGGPRRRGLRHRPARRRHPPGAAGRARPARRDHRPGPRRAVLARGRRRRRPRGRRGRGAPGRARTHPDRARVRTDRDGPRPVPPGRLVACDARGRAAGGAVRGGGLLRRGGGLRHPPAARPARAADRDRLRQRPHGDGRPVRRHRPRRRRARPALDHGLRRHRARRSRPARPDHGQHQRPRLGPRRRGEAARARRRPRPRPHRASTRPGWSCAARPGPPRPDHAPPPTTPCTHHPIPGTTRNGAPP